MKIFPIFVIFRILIGLVFLVSGFQKATQPIQNFMYVIESYDFLPYSLVKITAHIVPWVELFVGIFMTVGLWLPAALSAATIFFISFQCLLAQAMWRNLPIDKCGCFGEAFSVPMPVMFLIDTAFMFLCLLLMWKFHLTMRCSLDHYFSKS